MAHQHASSGFQIERIPENLLREPLDYMFADHYRQRMVCDMLDELRTEVESGGCIPGSDVINLYLENDLAFHIADEEESLFPRLRDRCLPEDQLEGVIDILSEEHAKDDLLSTGLKQQLEALAKSGVPQDRDWFIKLSATYVEAQRRHLTWENGVLLPLARKRLNAQDLAELGREMAARRGVLYLDREP
jgi:hemerythrin-like domain-containing protein